MCGERKKRQRVRKDEQGTGELGRRDRGEGWKRPSFWGRKETENSAVGCALYRTVPEPSCPWCMGRGGGWTV